MPPDEERKVGRRRVVGPTIRPPPLLHPMGDLTRFAIDDLTPDEEDECFKLLERA